jgi:hypothetical protein
MRALRGGIPRALPSHRTRRAFAYRVYCAAKLARLGPLPADARPWLKEAGRLTLDLDALRDEAEVVRQVFTNGAGRRARDTARVKLRQLERRAGRLRVALEAAERRLEELAGSNGSGPGDLAARLAAHHRETSRA